MIFPAIKKLGRKFNLLQSNGQVFGLYNNYFIKLGDGKGYKYFYIETGDLKNLSGEITVELTGRKKEFNYYIFRIESNGIYFHFREVVKSFPGKKIEALMEFITAWLTEHNIAGTDKCSVCNDTKVIHYYHIHNEGLKLCDRCYEKKNQELEDAQNQFKTEEKNYLSGALGAIIFAVPSMAIGVLFYVFLQKITALGAFILTLTAYWGYKVFRGKPGPFTPVIIIIICIICVFLNEYVSVYFALLKAGSTHSTIMYNLFTNHVLIKTIRGELIMTYAFACLVWILFLVDYVNKSRAPKLKKAKSIQSV